MKIKVTFAYDGKVTEHDLEKPLKISEFTSPVLGIQLKPSVWGLTQVYVNGQKQPDWYVLQDGDSMLYIYICFNYPPNERDEEIQKWRNAMEYFKQWKQNDEEVKQQVKDMIHFPPADVAEALGI